MPRLGGIGARILLLVLASIALVSTVNLLIAWRGPPPRAMPFLSGEMAAVLRGEGGRASLQRLVVGRAAGAPAPRHHERRNREAERRLAQALGRAVADVRVYTAYPLPPPPGMLPGSLLAAARDGTGWRVAATAPEPRVSRWQWTTLAGILATALLLGAAGWWLARAISRPIADLAARAAAAGPRHFDLPVPSSAPAEVRTLAAAFSALGERLQRHVANRTATLAAIAHDMGTPLTRLAFHIERLPDAERTRAEADLAEMRAMLASVLSFSRDALSSAPSASVDLGSLVDSLVEDMIATGAALTLSPGPRAVVRGEAAALRRMVANLADNALRYAGEAELGWTIADGVVTVSVADHGPGIDPADADRLFEPFVRGEPSRNRGTGGTGLGLAIVRGIAESHGGTAAIAPRDGGGTIASVRLPIIETR